MSTFTATSTRLITLALGASALAVACTPSGAEESQAPADSGRIEIVSPSLNEEVTGPVEFVIDRGAVDTTGDTVGSDAGGAFWLIVDQGCVPVGDELPVADPGHHRVPDGEDSVTVDLAAGSHEICLQFADASNITYYEIDEITISVEV
jgi:hypothetical protein